MNTNNLNVFINKSIEKLDKTISFFIYFIYTNIFRSISKIIKKDNRNYLKFNIGFTKFKLIKIKRIALIYSQKNVICNPISEFDWKKVNLKTYIIPEQESNSHILINGMSGFGKSTLIKSLLIDIYKNKKAAIVFDAHSEHCETISSLKGKNYDVNSFGFNLLELNGLSVNERISELSQLFKDTFSLGYIQTMKLSECLWYTYRKFGALNKNICYLKSTPTFYNLLQEINIFVRNAKSISEKNTLLHLKNRIELLNTKSFIKNNISLQNIKNGINSISLAALKTKQIQSIYIFELLKRLYSTMHDNQKENGLKLYVIIDESELILELSDIIINKLITEGRKYGIGVIIVTHTTSNLSKQILANVSTYISFFTREPHDLNYISDLISGTDTVKKILVKNKLINLKQNQAILISTKIRTPLVIQTMHISKILKILHLIDLENRNLINNKENRIEEYNNQEKNIINNKIIKLNDIIKKPIKVELLNILFNDKEMDIIKNSKDIDKFIINEKGINEEWIMLRNNSKSIEHELFVKKIHEELIKERIKNIINNNYEGPDIIIYQNNKKIAIEYETGRKNIFDTYKMIRKREQIFDSIIMFVNNTAFESYSKFFKNNNLKKLEVFNINEYTNKNIFNNIK